MLKKELIEHKTVKGFYKHPTHAGIFVSEDGLVYSDVTEHLVIQRLRGNYYVALGLERHVHLLVCETFLTKPTHELEIMLVGNHKNGITTNNSVSNLEWVTYSENSNHAYRTGLRPDNIPILIKDLRSGEVVSYYSIEEASRTLKVSGASIQWFLKPVNFGKIFCKYYIVIKEGGVWPNIGQDAINPSGYGHERQIYVEDFKQNIRIIFRNVGEAGAHFGIKKHTLYAQLRKAISKGLTGHITECFGIWYFDTYLKEIPADVKMQPKRAKRVAGESPTRMPVPIVITDLVTGHTETVASSEVYARRLGVKKNTFQKHIYQNDGVWKKRFLVHYVNVQGPTE